MNFPMHAHEQHAEADFVALRQASQALDSLMSAQAVDVQAIVADFEKIRKKSSPAAIAKAR